MPSGRVYTLMSMPFAQALNDPEDSSTPDMEAALMEAGDICLSE